MMFLNPVEIVVDVKLNHSCINEMMTNINKSITVSKVKVKDQLGFLTLPQLLNDSNHGNESLANVLDSADEYVLKGLDLVKT